MGEATDAIAGLTDGDAEMVGRYVWSTRQDTWWWSEGMYEIHGFAPGEVVPSTDLLLAHKHPEDVDRARVTIKDALETGAPYSCYHRIIDARNKERSVVVAGDSAKDTAGNVIRLQGFLVDLTETRRRDSSADARRAVEGATRHRAAIEQAKGVLMLAYGIDSDAAFAILRSCSLDSNIKVNVIAERLAAELPHIGPGSPQLAATVSRLLQHQKSPCPKTESG